MSAKIVALAQRRAELIERAAHQRAEIAVHYTNCGPALRLADSGWRIIRFIRTLRGNPLLVAGIAAIAGRLFSGRFKILSQLSTWSARLTTAWQLFGRVRSIFARPRA